MTMVSTLNAPPAAWHSLACILAVHHVAACVVRAAPLHGPAPAVHEVCSLPLRTWSTVPCLHNGGSRALKARFFFTPYSCKGQPGCARGSTRWSTLCQLDQLRIVHRALLSVRECRRLYGCWMLHRQQNPRKPKNPLSTGNCEPGAGRMKLPTHTTLLMHVTSCEARAKASTAQNRIQK